VRIFCLVALSCSGCEELLTKPGARGG
jgi:hypothetical protein